MFNVLCTVFLIVRTDTATADESKGWVPIKTGLKPPLIFTGRPKAVLSLRFYF